MPYCPNCGYEYKDEKTSCPDCDVELVEALPEVEETMYKDWVAVAKLTSRQFAEMLIEELHEKDIPAVVYSDAGFFGMTGQMGLTSFQPAGSGYEIMVPVEFVVRADQEAEAILGETWVNSRLIDIEEYSEEESDEDEEEELQ